MTFRFRTLLFFVLAMLMGWSLGQSGAPCQAPVSRVLDEALQRGLLRQHASLQEPADPSTLTRRTLSTYSANPVDCLVRLQEIVEADESAPPPTVASSAFLARTDFVHARWYIVSFDTNPGSFAQILQRLTSAEQEPSRSTMRSSAAALAASRCLAEPLAGH